MIGKYVEKFVRGGRGDGQASPGGSSSGGVDLSFLHKTGFL
jgi:hypothetical protein